jgi:glutathione peroxidase
MNPLKIFMATLATPQGEKPPNLKSFYDIKINGLNGKPIDLSDFKDRYVLVVNVASKCGFTSQYKDLQALHDLYKDQLTIIGVPCNQFGGQEPGDADAITSFCEVNYGVSFLMTEKVDVKGKSQHPLFAWLTDKSLNGKQDSTVKWNFQKYLIDGNGNFVDYFFSLTNPSSKKITKYFR